MKLLFVCPWIPWPLDDGGRIRTFNLIRHAAQKTEIHFRAVLEPGQDPEAVRALEPHCASIRAYGRGRPGPWMRWSAPKIERWFHSPALQAELRAELEDGDFDLVHLDELVLTRLLPADVGTPVIQHHHKLDTVLYERLGGPRRTTNRFDLFKLHKLEQEGARLWKHHLVCGEGDRELLLERYPHIDCTVLPSGYDPEFHRPSSPPPGRDPNKILFLGSMSYGPNVDGVLQFVRDMLPPLRARHPELVLSIVGKSPAREVLELAGQGVEVVGSVPDVRPHLERAAVMVVPLRIGGGTRLKIVEALAMGCPVVSTAIGAEGLDLRAGEHLSIAKSTPDFIEAVEGLLADPARASAMTDRGRKHIELHYTWPRLAQELVSIWDRARSQ